MDKGFALESKSTKEESEKAVKQALQEWMSCFKSLEDPRGRQGREHVD